MSETLNSNAPEHDYEQDLNLAEQKAVELNKLSREVGTTNMDSDYYRTGTGGITTVNPEEADAGGESLEFVEVHIPPSKKAKPGFEGTTYTYELDKPHADGKRLGLVKVFKKDTEEKRHYVTHIRTKKADRIGAAIVNKALNEVLPDVISVAEARQNKIADGLEKLKS